MIMEFLFVAISATVVALLYNFVCGAAGFFICRVVLGTPGETIRPFRSAVTPIVLSLAVGQAVFGAVWQILAVHGRFQAIWVGSVLIVGAAAALLIWNAGGRRLPRFGAITVGLKRVPAYGWVMLFMMTIVVVISWTRSFGWPDGDAMAFYLAQPKLIAHSGFFSPLADYERFAEIGLFAEMNVAVMFLADGEMAARAWLWQAGMLLALAVFALCAEAGLPTGARILGALIVLTSSAILLVMTDGKSDHVAAAWAVAAVLSAVLVDWRAPFRPVFLAAVLGASRRLPSCRSWSDFRSSSRSLSPTGFWRPDRTGASHDWPHVWQRWAASPCAVGCWR